MKRLFFAGVVFILAALPVTAAEVIKTDVGVANEEVDVSQSDSCQKGVTDCVLEFVFSGGMKAVDVRRPSFLLLRTMFDGVTQLLPKVVKTTTIPKDLMSNWISGWARLYVRNPDTGEEYCVPADRPYLTDPIADFAQIDQFSRQVSSITTRYSVTGKGGVYDMREPPVEIANPPPCPYDDIGLFQDESQVKTADPGGNFLQVLINIFKQLTGDESYSQTVEAYIYSKQADDYVGRNYCLVSGCTQSPIDLSYLQSGEEVKRVTQGGGVGRTFSPFTHDPSGGTEHGNAESWFEIEVSGKGLTQVDTRTNYTKASECAGDYVALSVLPYTIRSKYLQPNPDCVYAAPTPTPGACQAGEEGESPNLPPASGSCKLGGNSLGLPPSLIEAIEAAAEAYKVPPSLIVGVIYGEGSFNPGSQFFDDGFVQEQLKECAQLPGCDPNGSVYQNIVPFIPTYWEGLKDAVKVVDPDREPNACNLLDGIFAIAKDLSQNQFGSPDFFGKRCFNIPLNTPQETKASGSCSWETENVETAIRVWEFGTAYDSTYTCATLEGSCLTGGGVDARCPGGDVCETISNRSANPSHNGCVYDVYQTNR